VYGLDVAPGVVYDTGSQAIDSNYVVDTMYGVVVGEEMVEDGCAADKIANPDNITYLPKYGVLAIGEDSSASGDGSNTDYFDRDLGNFIWAYDVKANSLTRIASTPAGAETTSPYWNPNINGWGYLIMVNQHPDDVESEVGYVGPFPQLD
jgi:secreted PhoX family phosphatase